MTKVEIKVSHLGPNYRAPVVSNCSLVNLSSKPFQLPFYLYEKYNFSMRAFLYFQQLFELRVVLSCDP